MSRRPSTAAEERALVAAFRELRREYGRAFTIDDAIDGMSWPVEDRIADEVHVLGEHLAILQEQEARRAAGGRRAAVTRALEQLGEATSQELAAELRGLWGPYEVYNSLRERDDVVRVGKQGRAIRWALRAR